MTGRGFIAPAGGALLVVLLWLPLKLTHLVVNTSDSLPHNAYAMVDGAWLARRGAYVALVPPAAFQGVFGDGERLVFIKRLDGVAGDALTHRDGAVCLPARCYRPARGMDGAVPALTPPQIIPEGKLAAFGDSPTSLDSRYAAIGLFDRSDILAAGWPIPFWHWTEVRAWLDRRQ
jgi:conjugal transfer pilin signal peptidase TrbI